MTKYFYFFYSAVVDFQVALVVKNFPVAQRVKNLLAMQETRVRSLGREEPLEKGMATHSSIPAYLKNSMERGAWRATVHGIANS